MNDPDTQKALQIMELNSDATKDEISKRYGILTRKFRTMETDENGYTMEDITRAYNLLMGITFVDEREEARQKALRENPPFLARLLKMDPVKMENFFHYYKIHILVILAVAVFLFFSVKSCVNQVPYDFSVVFFGEVAAEDEQKVADNVKEKMSEIVNPSIQFLQSSASDAQYQSAIQMKLMAMVAAQEMDILIVNESTFEMHAAQGMYMALDDIKDRFTFSEDRYVAAAEIIDETEDGELIFGPDKIYGIKISESEFLKENGISGENLIAAIVANTTREESSIQFMQLLE